MRQLLIRGGLLGEDAAERLVQHDPRTATKTVVDAAAGGDSRVLEALADAAAALGRVVDDLTGALNPYAVVLGGYLGPLGAHVLGTIEARTDRALSSGMGGPGCSRCRYWCPGSQWVAPWPPATRASTTP